MKGVNDHGKRRGTESWWKGEPNSGGKEGKVEKPIKIKLIQEAETDDICYNAICSVLQCNVM